MAGERGPKELVPGDPDLIWEMADSLSTLGVAFEDIGRGLMSIDAGGWRGAAADAFHVHFDRQPKRFLTAADAFGTAAVALDDYASALSWAQRQATEALAAMASEEHAPDPAPPLTVTQQVEQTGVLASIGEAPRPEPRTTAAADILNRALDQIQRIGHDAARKLREASALAPRQLWRPPAATQVVRRGAGSLIRLSVAKHDAVSAVDAAAHHPDARFKEYLDHDTLRDRTDAWGAGVAELRKRLRRLGLDQLSPRLEQHIFEGHVKKRKRGVGYRELGYHHREGGVDRGAMRVVRVVAGPDANGVYRARVAGPKTEGGPELRVSTFFPDSWTREDVLRAIRFAFLNRTCFDQHDPSVRRKWRGRARGLLIEGYVECQAVEPSVGARSARLYHVVTAYPIYRSGDGRGRGD